MLELIKGLIAGWATNKIITVSEKRKRDDDDSLPNSVQEHEIFLCIATHLQIDVNSYEGEEEE